MGGRWWAVALVFAAGCAQLLGLSDPTLGDTGADAPPPADAKLPPDARPDAAAPVTITVSITGDGAGRVTSIPSGIDCPGTCSAAFPYGALLRLTVATNGGTSFTGWTPACGSEITCGLNPTADATVDVALKDNSDGHNFVFATQETYDPSTLSPLTTADANCNASAAKAKLPGTYVAWISGPSTNARERIPATARGWVRTDGLPFADRVADFIAGKIFYPARLDAIGSSNDNGPAAATGTDEAGNVLANLNCAGWTSASASDRMMTGNPSDGPWTWTRAGEWTCDQKIRLYCFGTTSNKPVMPPAAPPSHRLAFLSTKGLAIPLVGGIDAADAQCKMDAQAAGFPGTYKALLAMNGVAPASRFSGDGPPWVRPDGVVLAFPGTSLLDGVTLKAPIAETSAGIYVPPMYFRIAGGSSSPNTAGTPDTTCDDWTLLDASKHYMPSHPNITRNWWGTFTTPCNDHSPGSDAILCLQE